MNGSASPGVSWYRVTVVAVACLAIAVVATWRLGLVGSVGAPPNANALMVIAPYEYNGTWVFDDARAGLVREPFVAGVPEMIDLLVAEIPNAKEGFRLLFSARPFPEYQKKLTWVRGDMDGNYYKLDEPPMEGWICPAMFKYYEQPPAEIYVKAEAKS